MNTEMITWRGACVGGGGACVGGRARALGYIYLLAEEARAERRARKVLERGMREQTQSMHESACIYTCVCVYIDR